MEIQLGHKDGLVLAKSLFHYFQRIPEATSSIFYCVKWIVDCIIENTMNTRNAYKQY